MELINIDTPEGMTQAVDWLRQNLRVIKEGGCWVIPKDGMIIEISHQNKTAQVKLQLRDNSDHRRVFEAMGWTFTGLPTEKGQT